ncbi:hypothetical protein HDU97_004453 [Phlyctochytrium planicorne]|nr:hypothetical protein HDU97_004453 [Phlyctochytrium planicorne]
MTAMAITVLSDLLLWDELVINILRFCDITTLTAVLQSNKKLRELARSSTIWTHKLQDMSNLLQTDLVSAIPMNDRFDAAMSWLRPLPSPTHPMKVSNHQIPALRTLPQFDGRRSIVSICVQQSQRYKFYKWELKDRVGVVAVNWYEPDKPAILRDITTGEEIILPDFKAKLYGSIPGTNLLVSNAQDPETYVYNYGLYQWDESSKTVIPLADSDLILQEVLRNAKKLPYPAQLALSETTIEFRFFASTVTCVYRVDPDGKGLTYVPSVPPPPTTVAFSNGVIARQSKEPDDQTYITFSRKSDQKVIKTVPMPQNTRALPLMSRFALLQECPDTFRVTIHDFFGSESSTFTFPKQCCDCGVFRTISGGQMFKIHPFESTELEVLNFYRNEYVEYKYKETHNEVAWVVYKDYVEGLEGFGRWVLKVVALDVRPDGV